MYTVPYKIFLISQEIFKLGLQCVKCQKLSMPSNDYNNNYQCTNCNFVFDAKKQLMDLVVAEEYFDKCNYMLTNILQLFIKMCLYLVSDSNKIEYLFKCEILREKILYKNHHLLYCVYLSLQLFYGHTGIFIFNTEGVYSTLYKYIYVF